jgi:undecaprenyl diphosphate synthase
MVHPLDLAGIFDPELRASFERCDDIHRSADPITHQLIVTYLPAQKQPFAQALHGYLTTSDNLADDGDPEEFDRWMTASLREVDAGRSEHPVRAAFVHTMRRWQLDPALLTEFLVATKQDSRRTAPFTTFDELRVFLRGVAGVPARLLLPLLEPVTPTPAASELMSLLGEVFQLVDIFRDFTVDIPRGRHYLPTSEVKRHGDKVIEHQVQRARRMIDEGCAVLDLVHPSSRAFLEASIAGCQTYLDHVSRLGQRIVTDGDQFDGLPRQRTTSTVARERLPKHLAVIMDGNGRWAQRRGRHRLAGHAAAEHVLFDLLDAALEIGLRYVSAFAFSTENWSRPSTEVNGLMDLLARMLPRRIESLRQQGVRVRWAGRRDRVPTHVRTELEWAERLTEDNDRLTAIVCLDYGGRAELTQAAQRLAKDVVAGRKDVNAIAEPDLAGHLYLPDVPDVDLLVRTSGEQRISNFLLWQAAYAELVFIDKLWPDLDRRDLLQALETFAARDRRFGASTSAAPATTG